MQCRHLSDSLFSGCLTTPAIYPHTVLPGLSSETGLRTSEILARRTERDTGRVKIPAPTEKYFFSIYYFLLTVT